MNEELLKRLDLLAAKLGVTAQYLWAVLVKESRIEACLDFAVGVTLIAIAVFVVRYAFGRMEDEDLGVVAVMVAVVFSVIGLYYLYSAVPEFLNPEYSAFQSIMKVLK